MLFVNSSKTKNVQNKGICKTKNPHFSFCLVNNEIMIDLKCCYVQKNSLLLIAFWKTYQSPILLIFFSFKNVLSFNCDLFFIENFGAIGAIFPWKQLVHSTLKFHHVNQKSNLYKWKYGINSVIYIINFFGTCNKHEFIVWLSVLWWFYITKLFGGGQNML